MEETLPRSFYDRDTTSVARGLLGARILLQQDRTRLLARIVETEAYVRNDPANHAYRGETTRNRSMFAGPGHLYVYRIHQVHCANVVTRNGTAVLLRAAEAISPNLPSLSGPGRLCRTLGITRTLDGIDLVRSRAVRIFPSDLQRARIIRGPRVGIRYAADRPLRFAIQGNRHVSRPFPPGWSETQRSFAQL